MFRYYADRLSFLLISNLVGKTDTEVKEAAVDEKLNAQKYIVPGLGDFGDRYFGTEHF